MSDVLIDPKVQDPSLADGDHDRFSHIVRKADANRGYIGGEEIEALCGKRWVPSHNPDRYPICETCVEVAQRIINKGDN